MNVSRTIAFAFSLLAAGTSGRAQTADAPLALTAAAGKTVCQSRTTTFNGAPAKAELCVTQGSFSPDRYVVKIDGQIALQGIDDQTTAGITASHKARKVTLQCVPQNVMPNVTLEDVRRMLPAYAPAKAQELVELMKGSNLPVEIARLCQASEDGSPLLAAQVFFE